MISNLLIAGLLICLSIVIFQDIKYRKIHIVLPILVFLGSYLISKNNDINSIILKNTGFFLLILTILTAYMSIKNKSFLNPFQNYFGLGDFLFFIAITPLFLIHNYVLFFISSMLFSIFLQLMFRKNMKHDSVPLAGFVSILLILVILKDILLNFEKFTVIK